MRSKRVIVVGAIALIAVVVFALVVRAVRIDARPFDDGVALVERAPVDDFELPEGAKFVATTDGKQGTLLLMLNYQGQTFGISFPWIVADQDVGASMDFQMSTLRRREDGSGVVGPESRWIPVRVRQEWRGESGMIGEGFASRGDRAMVTLKRDRRIGVHMWNARGNAVQDVLVSPKNDEELRELLAFVERWRVPECVDEAELKAKWEAFVGRVRGK